MNGIAAAFVGLTVFAGLNLVYALVMVYLEHRERKRVRVTTVGTTTYIECHPKLTDKEKS